MSALRDNCFQSKVVISRVVPRRAYLIMFLMLFSLCSLVPESEQISITDALPCCHLKGLLEAGHALSMYKTMMHSTFFLLKYTFSHSVVQKQQIQSRLTRRSKTQEGNNAMYLEFKNKVKSSTQRPVHAWRLKREGKHSHLEIPEKNFLPVL